MSTVLLTQLVSSGTPGRLIPFALQRALLEPLFQQLFEAAFNRGELAFLYRRWIRIRVTDAGFVWSVSAGTHGLVLAQDPFTPDVDFAGRLQDFVLLAARRVDPDTLFFQRRIQITGDTDLGVACKNVLDAVDEKQLPLPLRGLLNLAANRIEAETQGCAPARLRNQPGSAG